MYSLGVSVGVCVWLSFCPSPLFPVPVFSSERLWRWFVRSHLPALFLWPSVVERGGGGGRWWSGFVAAGCGGPLGGCSGRPWRRGERRLEVVWGLWWWSWAARRRLEAWWKRGVKAVVVLVQRASVPLLRGGRLLRPSTCWSGLLLPAVGGTAAALSPRVLGIAVDPSVSSPIAQGVLCTFLGSPL